MTTANRGSGNPAGSLDTEYIRQTSIERLDQALLVADAVTPGSLPMHQGSALRWTLNEHLTRTAQEDIDRFHALTHTAGNAIIDYENRAQNQRAYNPKTVTKTMDYYGEFVPVRQVDLDWMPKSFMDDLADTIGYSGAETLNGLCSAEVDGRGAGSWSPDPGTGTTNIYHAGDGADLSGKEKLTATDIYIVKGKMKNLNVRPFDDGYFRAYVTPLAAVDMQTDAASGLQWKEINQYVGGRNAQVKLTNGEVGAVGGVMVFETTDLQTVAEDTTQVYYNMVLGKNGLGGARQGDMDVNVFINRSDASSIDDPFRMIATVAYRLKAAETILREEACWLLKSSDGS